MEEQKRRRRGEGKRGEKERRDGGAEEGEKEERRHIQPPSTGKSCIHLDRLRNLKFPLEPPHSCRFQ